MIAKDVKPEIKIYSTDNIVPKYTRSEYKNFATVSSMEGKKSSLIKLESKPTTIKQNTEAILVNTIPENAKIKDLTKAMPNKCDQITKERPIKNEKNVSQKQQPPNIGNPNKSKTSPKKLTTDVHEYSFSNKENIYLEQSYRLIKPSETIEQNLKKVEEKNNMTEKKTCVNGIGGDERLSSSSGRPTVTGCKRFIFVKSKKAT